jgi:glycosyltransferase involved in cell wall biosynthesis
MLRDRLGLPTDAAIIGLVARYHPMKDVETFLRAVSLFQQDHANARFVLCGDGMTSDNAALTELVRSFNLGRRIALLGRRPDIELIYPTFDVLTLCSIGGEGFPNVLCEAMACDVPCVATNIGDSAEIIGNCGLIVPTRDHEALAAAWHTLLEKRSQFGNVRSQVAARHSLQHMCAQYETFYRSIVQKPAKTQPCY